VGTSGKRLAEFPVDEKGAMSFRVHFAT
jgi:hypothetical protein